MRGARIRLQYAVALFVLLPTSVGVIAVRASATCEKFVRTYVTRPVRNRVSKATADAWAAWRIAHPNWKPNPNLHRPKYLPTREEQMKKVEFACEVPTEPSDVTIFFKTAEIEPPPILLLPSMSTQTAMPVLPTQVAEVVTPLPVLEAFAPPPPILVPPVNTGIPPTTPEPASLLMVGTGLAWLLLIGRRSMSRGGRAAHFA